MSNQVNSMNKGLTVKDLVTTGIFTALLFVFVLDRCGNSFVHFLKIFYNIIKDLYTEMR